MGATLVAKAAEALGRDGKFDHPVLDLPGWWRRPGRCHGRRRFETLPANIAHARPLEQPRGWILTLLISFGPALLIIGIFFWDFHGHILDANDAFLEMVGQPH